MRHYIQASNRWSEDKTMHTKDQILAALDLAIADHQVTAGSGTDWEFISELRAAKTIISRATVTSVPVDLTTATEA